MKQKNKKSPIIFANSKSGTHEGHITFITNEDLNERYLFCRFSANNTVSKASSSVISDHQRAIGINTDKARKNEPVNIHILGTGSSTFLALAGADIDQGQEITHNNEGKAIPINGLANETYSVYGIALTKSLANSLVEFAPVYGERNIG